MNIGTGWKDSSGQKRKGQNFSLFACKPGKKAADKDRNKYSVTTARFIRLIKTGVRYPFPVLSYWKVYNTLGMDR